MQHFSSQGFCCFQICYRKYEYLQEGGGTNQATTVQCSAWSMFSWGFPISWTLCFGIIQDSLCLAGRGLCWESQSGSKQPVCFGKCGVSIVRWAADHHLSFMYGWSWPFTLGGGQQFLLDSCYRAMTEFTSIIPSIQMCHVHTHYITDAVYWLQLR